MIPVENYICLLIHLILDLIKLLFKDINDDENCAEEPIVQKRWQPLSVVSAYLSTSAQHGA